MRIKYAISIISLLLTIFNVNLAYANPITCPSNPIPEDAYWRPDGAPAGNNMAVVYYQGIQGVYCYYDQSFGFIRSKFPVLGPDGDDWQRATPCPLEKACYVCHRTSENSCRFRS